MFQFTLYIKFVQIFFLFVMVVASALDNDKKKGWIRLCDFKENLKQSFLRWSKSIEKCTKVFQVAILRSV